MAPTPAVNTTSGAHGISNMRHYDEYYFRDGNVSFVVEGTVFRLHRYFFERESQYFRDQLAPSSTRTEASNDAPCIINIQDVKIEEFALFAWVFYNPKYTYSNKTKEQWLTILKLATKWQFKEVRSLSIRELEKLDIDPVEKIAIYKEFKIKPELLLPSYISICKKDRLPSPEEGKILSIETVLKIASAREEMILSALSSGRRSPADAPDDITRAIIARLFELGLTPHPNDQPVNGVERPNPTSNNINGSDDTQPKRGFSTTNGVGSSGGQARGGGRGGAK